MMKLIVVSMGFSAMVHPSSGQTRSSATYDPVVEDQILGEARMNIENVRKSVAGLSFHDEEMRPIAGARVRVDQISQDFLFGALSDGALSPKFSPDEAARFRELFVDLFNFTIVKVYWAGYEPEQGRPQWQELDGFLSWCVQQNLTVKGHPLAWTHPAGTPNWLLALPDEAATSLLDARIRNLVGGWQGRIDMWDVVNEPVTTVPWETAMLDPANTDWEIASGKRYHVSQVQVGEIVPWVERAFRNAAEANPEGNFILNEFFMIARPEVRAKFCELLGILLDRGVPVRGIGIQAHEPREMWFSPSQFKEALDDLARFGLPLHITEFIPQSAGKPIEGWRSGTWTQEAQAEFAEEIYTQAFGHPAVASINWWSFSDRDTWLEGGGLVDENLNPKPAYRLLKKLIRDDWMTREVDLVTDSTGAVEFSGFHGRYRVEVVLPGGDAKSMEIHLERGGENTWQFEM
ncbi:MAG: endo-1,4-beta-xylanase [Opitutaceae bacterium]